MKVKITQELLDYDGTPMREGEVKLTKSLVSQFESLFISGKVNQKGIIDSLRSEVDREPFTYRVVINNALNSITQEGDRPEVLSATDKAKCYEITKKIFSSKEPDLTDDQITFIIQRVEKVYLLPIICGRIREFFKRGQ